LAGGPRGAEAERPRVLARRDGADRGRRPRLHDDGRDRRRRDRRIPGEAGVSYEGQIAEAITLVGHGGDRIEAYFARPIGATGVPGVVVFHHGPGWDEWTKEVVRKLAHHGYAAICPHLFGRFGPG